MSAGIGVPDTRGSFSRSGRNFKIQCDVTSSDQESPALGQKRLISG